jgi:hypothetical protein
LPGALDWPPPTRGLSAAFELRDTTTLAQTNPAGAYAALTAFQPKFKARIAGWADEDLIDDVAIVQQYVDVLHAHAPGTTSP